MADQILSHENVAAICSFHKSERMRSGADMLTLIAWIEDEPARLASARAEGVREGIEMAARWHEAQEPLMRAVGAMVLADSHVASAIAIRALSPPPAEPTGMTAEQIVSVLGDPLGGVEIKPAEPLNVQPGTVVAWDGKSDLPSFTTAEPSAPVAEGQ